MVADAQTNLISPDGDLPTSVEVGIVEKTKLQCQGQTYQTNNPQTLHWQCLALPLHQEQWHNSPLQQHLHYAALQELHHHL